VESQVPFDVVFMDNIMKEMNGPEAAEKMRALGFTNHIIGITGNVVPGIPLNRI